MDGLKGKHDSMDFPMKHGEFFKFLHPSIACCSRGSVERVRLLLTAAFENNNNNNMHMI
jgi:hypothetical protein